MYDFHIFFTTFIQLYCYIVFYNLNQENNSVMNLLIRNNGQESFNIQIKK